MALSRHCTLCSFSTSSVQHQLGMPKTGNFRVDYLWAVVRGCEWEGLLNWDLVTGIERFELYSAISAHLFVSNGDCYEVQTAQQESLCQGPRVEVKPVEMKATHDMVWCTWQQGSEGSVFSGISQTRYYFMLVSSPSSFVRKITGCSFAWLTTAE